MTKNIDRAIEARSPLTNEEDQWYAVLNEFLNDPILERVPHTALNRFLSGLWLERMDA